jgi:hypothetical protein
LRLVEARGSMTRYEAVRPATKLGGGQKQEQRAALEHMEANAKITFNPASLTF